MARDVDDDDQLPPLGDDTAKFLEDAKKGKARSFLVVCKGAKIRYLAVKKKPVKKAELNEAKKLGYKGEGYFGVITGKGMDLVFNLARSDGYDAEPVKDKVLKDFLEEHAELKCKPWFQIVDSPPPIPFDDEDAQHPLIAKFLKLDEAVSKLLDRQPERAAELDAWVNEIRGLLQDGDYNAAGPKIDAFIKLLTAGAGPTETPAGSAAEFKAALKQLTPEINVALQNGVGDVQALQDGLTAIKEQAGRQDFAAALATCQELAGSLERTWKAQAKAILPRAKDLLESSFTEQAGDVSKIRTAVAMAEERAATERFASAALILTRLVPLLDTAASGAAPREADVIPEGIVAAMKEKILRARVRWDDGVKRALVELKKVQDGIRDVDDELAGALVEIVDGYQAKLGVLLTTAEKADASKTESARAAALTMTTDLKEEIGDDDLLAFLDSYQETSVNLQDAFLDALAEVEAHLSA